MTNDINQLRAALFETLEALKREEAPMEIARAEAIAGVAQTIINSAKVEIEYLKTTGGTTSNFLSPPQLPAIAGAVSTVTNTASYQRIETVLPGATITRNIAR